MTIKRRSISVKVKKALVEKYGPKCFYCGKEGMILKGHPFVIVEKEPIKKYINIYDNTFYLVHPAFHFDHVISVKNGGGGGLNNIVISCPRCNKEKGAKI